MASLNWFQRWACFSLICACGRFDNPIDPENATGTSKDAVKTGSGTVGGSVATTVVSGTTPSTLAFTKWQIALPPNSLIANVSYRSSTKRLYVLDAGAKQSLSFDVSSGVPTSNTATVLASGPTSNVGAWSDNGKFYSADNLGGLTSYNDSYVAQSKVNLSQYSVSSGGGVFESGSLIFYSIYSFVAVDVTAGSVAKLFDVDTTKLNTQLPLEGAPTFGFAKVANGYWVLASNKIDGTKLVRLDLTGAGVERAALPTLDTDESAAGLTSDGTNLWFVTNKNIFKVTISQSGG